MDSITPARAAEIDGALSEFYDTIVRERHAIEQAKRAAARYRDRGPGYEAFAAKQDEDAATAHASLAAAEAGAEPLEAIYRQHGWTRAWYVPGGHVHSTTRCSTCFPTTSFAWLTDLSGMDETDIVAQAGETACTVCYPTAPAEVLSRPRSFRYADDEARDAKRAERARKAAEQAEKAITRPDGAPLVLGYNRAATLVSAHRELAGALEDLLIDEHLHQYPNREYVGEKRQWVDMLIEAIAHKTRTSAEQVREEANGKAEKKFAKTRRDYERVNG